jgi:hypothetical protein
MNNANKIPYLKDIFNKEVAYYTEQVLLGERELVLVEQSLIKRKEYLLDSRFRLKFAKEELEKINNES